MMTQSELLKRARSLRAKGQHDESYALIAQFIAGNSEKSGVIEWEYLPWFWQSVVSSKGMLTRRNSDDVQFVRQFWATQSVMNSFHPNARQLPQRDEDLRRILQNEYCAVLSESRALHWVIKDKTGKPWGLVSITEISLMHRRGELLLGVLPGAPFGLTVTMLFVLFDFYFKRMGFNKLTSIIYPTNRASIKGTLHLGFKIEGKLEKHLYDIGSNDFVDILQTGLLRSEYLKKSPHPLLSRTSRPVKAS